MTNQELNQLRDEIHANAVAHGWWDEPRPIHECLFLAVTELSELFEAHRHSKLTDKTEKPIPLTNLQEELADFIIRILDLAGYLQFDFDVESESQASGEEFPDTVAWTVWSLTLWVADCHYHHSFSKTVVQAVEGARILGVPDLWHCVRVKHEYNKTRSYRHGGLKA